MVSWSPSVNYRSETPKTPMLLFTEDRRSSDVLDGDGERYELRRGRRGEY